MRLILLVVFVAFPVLELAVLVKLGGELGFWPTLGIIVASGLAGLGILRRQGFAVVGRVQDAVGAGRTPLEPVVDGMFFLVAGMLLISPGVIADILGLLLLVPLVRRLVARWSLSRVFGGGDATQRRTWRRSGSPERDGTRHPRKPWRRSAPSGNPNPKENPTVIDGEFERIDEAAGRPKEPKPD